MTKLEQKVTEHGIILGPVHKSKGKESTTCARWMKFLRQIDGAGDDSLANICVVVPGKPVQSIQMPLRELFEIVINSK